MGLVVVVVVRRCSWEVWGVYVWWWMGNTWSTREFTFFGKLPARASPSSESEVELAVVSWRFFVATC